MNKKKVIKIEDIKCPYCNHLLLRAVYVKGEIKCPRCKRIIVLETQKTELRATR
ncbi:Com family DNA-binding transcriptional regulator [Clostridium estertheticum]|uniref:Com family DNA-binding transcriptional regulator n=1 Tax=Clostridium estertheticum TaxID=238834 RepID=UPI0013EE803A|nr:Com family DNA-binding transcriptional regulator [Clostridium estertheticum]MBZ9608630.1 Com family DNA-binding transcriptional regulator [Clostridium estertheticum]